MTKNVFGQETRPVEISNWPIHRFYHLVEDGILDLNPPYQRGLVWDLEHKVKLIDSLVSGLGIPAVYFREKRDGYEVIDGKQRIHTICSFLMMGSLTMEKSTRSMTRTPGCIYIHHYSGGYHTKGYQ